MPTSPAWPRARCGTPTIASNGTRAEFAAWAERVAGAHGYRVTFEPVGGVDPEHGAPTQMGIFRRCG